MYRCRSLIEKRREINRQKGLAGVKARELKRIASHEGEPLRSDVDDSIEITVTRRVGGQIIRQDSLLLINEEGRGRIDQYCVWDTKDQRYLGLYGIYGAFIEAARRCPRVRAED